MAVINLKALHTLYTLARLVFHEVYGKNKKIGTNHMGPHISNSNRQGEIRHYYGRQMASERKWKLNY